MPFTVQGHRLLRDGAPVPFRQTPNMGGALRAEILVMHFTGSSSYSGAVNWLINPQAKASAHLVIAEDGQITQLAPFNRVTWHAGASSYQGRAGCNNFSIGIELVNAGMLARTAAGGYIERLSKRAVPADQVGLARHKNGGDTQPWEIYDPRQLAVAQDAAAAIVGAYRLRDIVGHDDIAPGRKSDPGPLFPMGSFESRVMGRA